MSENEKNNEATVLLTSAEARTRVVREDGSPRWSKAQFARLLAAGSIPAKRIGHRFFITAAALSAFLNGAGL